VNRLHGLLNDLCGMLLRILRVLPLLLTALCTDAFAQVPIAQARLQPPGSVVTVSGIVTSGSEFGSIRYMQDGSAGIAVFPGQGSVGGFAPAPGTAVTVTGILKLFNGLLEIDPVQSFTVTGTGNPLPAPVTITATQIGEAFESMLVRVNGAVFANAGATFTSTTWPFTSNGAGAVIYVRSSNPLMGTTIPSGPVDLVGIVSQFSTADPPVGGYQLLPRGPSDLLPSGGIAITGTVDQTDITASGFTLRWNTNMPGSSGVQYGATPALGQQVLVPGMGTQHAALLTGLPAAQFFHARAWSTAGGDTAFSATGYYSTASSTPGQVRAYFNRSVDHSVATGPPAVSLGSAIDDTVKAHIDRALFSIEVAMYNCSSTGMVNALNAAVQRGVQVRYVAEGGTTNSALQNMPQFPVLYRTNSTGSGMHNKFLAIDADDAARAVTLTGSTNFTNTSFFFDANNLVVVNDQALARAYRMEFEEMWGSAGPLPDPSNSRFGAQKQDNTPHLFNVAGTLIECRFSPSDGTQGRIDAALRTADQRISFALFALTSSQLTSTLAELHGLPEVTVRGLLDDAENGSASMLQLLAAGVPVGPDLVDGMQLHHKYAIVDHGLAELDPLVITGSHNWSFNAENHNDENTLIIHSAVIADQFHQEWAARNVGGVPVQEIDASAGLVLWPNPAQERLLVRLNEATPGAVHYSILSMTGVRVRQGAAGSQGVLELDVRSLSPGAYVLVIEQDDRLHRRVFIRQ
jgi:phosphatidylserine/phosphatidylglycerophosphate/cardiolipin synthase-like enzyme